MEGGISERAREILSEGAVDNPGEEDTAMFTEGEGGDTVFRIFRGRHTGREDPMAAADTWVRQAMELCTSLHGELQASAVWSDVDGGSVNVAITGHGIVAKEELEPHY